MSKFYDVVRILLAEDDPSREGAVAYLADQGFEGFLEENDSVTAYRTVRDNDTPVDAIINELPVDLSGKWEHEKIPEKNWNADWEASYDDVRMDKKLRIRAPFHPALPGFRYEIVIEPKMSFGTAHHPTTSLMLEALLDEDPKGLHILDMGTGTGVLAILAAIRGASKVYAVDNDEWAYDNARENVERNNAGEVEVVLGGAEKIKGKKFDLILANINRNVLLEDLEKYTACLKNGGHIIMSGFYLSDLPVIRSKAEEIDLSFLRYSEREQWACVSFIK